MFIYGQREFRGAGTVGKKHEAVNHPLLPVDYELGRVAFAE